jgi:hypothetical protein
MNGTRKRQVILVVANIFLPVLGYSFAAQIFKIYLSNSLIEVFAVAALWSSILFIITNKAYDKFATLFGAFIGPILVFPLSGLLQGFISNITHPTEFGNEIIATYSMFALLSSPIMIVLSIFNFFLTLKIYHQLQNKTTQLL